MIKIVVSVTTVISGHVIEMLGDTRVTWQEVHYVDPKKLKPNDRLALLNAEGPATVSMDVEHKLNGPQDSYSSVTVRIGISTRCDQNDRAVDEALSAMYRRAMPGVNHYMDPTMKALEDKLAQRRS